MMEDKEASFIEHLIELRKRLLLGIAGTLIIFLALTPFAKTLYTILAGPLLQALPAGGHMIATQVISPFFTPMKLALLAALVIAAPWWLYQMWLFIAPGLYAHEKKLFGGIVISSVFFFFLGLLFAYTVVFPLAFRFLLNAAPAGVEVMTDINEYLDFVMSMFMAFGFAFEVPIVVVLLARLGIVQVAQLKKARPYVIIGAFFIGAIITPPDVISQLLLAFPLWLLFEIGVFFAGYLGRKEALTSKEDISS
jgi:sec-independent protein translocase protein TatC